MTMEKYRLETEQGTSETIIARTLRSAKHQATIAASPHLCTFRLITPEGRIYRRRVVRDVMGASLTNWEQAY